MAFALFGLRAEFSSSFSLLSMPLSLALLTFFFVAYLLFCRSRYLSASNSTRNRLLHLLPYLHQLAKLNLLSQSNLLESLPL